MASVFHVKIVTRDLRDALRSSEGLVMMERPEFSAWIVCVRSTFAGLCATALAVLILRSFGPTRAGWSNLAGELTTLVSVLVAVLALTLSGFAMAPRLLALVEATDANEWRIILRVNTLAIQVAVIAALSLGASQLLLTTKRDTVPYGVLFVGLILLLSCCLMSAWLARSMAKLLLAVDRS